MDDIDEQMMNLSRVVGPLPNGLSMAYKWGLRITYKSWDDPPSNH